MKSSNITYVLEHIEKKPYCKAEDIVEGLQDKISRSVVFKILKELLSDKRIADVSDSRRENKFVLNKNNEFNIVKKEISDFKKNYYALLDKSLCHPHIVNVLNEIDHEFPKNNKSDTIPIAYKKTSDNFIKAKKINAKRKSLMRKLSNPVLGDKIENIDKTAFSESIVALKIPKITIQKMEKLAERNLPLIKKINTLSIKYSIYLKRAGYVTLTILPIYLFIMLVQFVILKSTSLWPSIVKDKEVLFKLNRFVYEDMLEINSELTKYLSKSDKYLGISQVVEINGIGFSFDTDEYILDMYRDYSILGMEKEISDVLRSFNLMRKKNVEYDLEEKVIDTAKENSELILEHRQRKHKIQ